MTQQYAKEKRMGKSKMERGKQSLREKRGKERIIREHSFAINMTSEQ